MAAVLNWHRQCRRYDEETLTGQHRPVTVLPLTALLTGPSGLGTTGARVGVAS
jgi:germacradienol/geosmin synthase